MINKTTKAIFLSLVMFTQMIVPSFAQETKNKEELKEQIEATNTLTNEELKDDSLTKTEKVNDDIENEESSILETQEDSVTSQEIMSEKRGTISVDINIGTVGNFKISKAVFALYNKELEFIDQKEIFVDNTGVNHNITFNVPEYDVGESFYLSCTEGFDCVK